MGNARRAAIRKSLTTKKPRNPLRADPQQLGTLRRRFVAEMRARFAGLRKAVRQMVDKGDAFGLRESKPVSARSLLGNTVWKFESDADKLALFKKWVKEQVDAGVLLPSDATLSAENAWMSPYLRSAYLEGTSKAYTSARGTELANDYELFGQGREAFLNQAFTAPAATSKVRLIYARAYDQLEGVSAAVSQQLSGILASGISEGRGPAVIARQMDKAIEKISRTRAETIARTELAHAHSEGQLDGFEMLGIEEIMAFAEWSTAGDDRVCPVCQPLEGVIMTIKEARGKIPRHPNCRCAWIPANVGEAPASYQKFSKSAIAKAQRASVKAETGKRGKAASTWSGATQTFRGKGRVKRVVAG